ncbi:MAG: SAM-dependent methyltransferase [Vicinamibacterales bacterium]
MWLPSFSNSMYVAWLRHLQCVHEDPDRRNPDTLVSRFFPWRDRLRARLLPKHELARLRRDPFYYYVLARTRYYDAVTKGALAEGVRTIVAIGSGSDTRAYRFGQELSAKHVTFIEADQAGAVAVKERMTSRWRRGRDVRFVPIDLHDAEWPALFDALGSNASQRALVFLEGVTPYVHAPDMHRFFTVLSARLAPESEIAYDGKLLGANDSLGRTDRATDPFRVPATPDAARALHDAHGLHLDAFERSDALSVRLVPRWPPEVRPFAEDVLLRLRVRR